MSSDRGNIKVFYKHLHKSIIYNWCNIICICLYVLYLGVEPLSPLTPPPFPYKYTLISRLVSPGLN